MSRELAGPVRQGQEDELDEEELEDDEELDDALDDEGGGEEHDCENPQQAYEDC